MRKVFCVMIICILTCASISSFADTYQFDSLDFSITCSSKWTPFFKDLKDEQLSRFGLSRQDVDETLKHYGLLDSDFVLEDFDDEITLMILKNKEPLSMRLNEKTDAFLSGFLMTFIPGVEANNGIDIIDYDLFHTDDNVFIQYQYASPHPMLTYYTTADGISYNFTFVFFNRKEISDAQKELSEQIIQTVKWKW